MTGSASRRKPLRAFGSLRLGSWALERSNRRGQDKSRKVRTVGSMRNRAKFSTCRTHCEHPMQLAFCHNALSSLLFPHLRAKS